ATVGDEFGLDRVDSYRRCARRAAREQRGQEHEEDEEKEGERATGHPDRDARETIHRHALRGRARRASYDAWRRRAPRTTGPTNRGAWRGHPPAAMRPARKG